MIVSDYAIRFRAAVFLFVAILAGAGLYAYTRLPREENPDITLPNVYVNAFYEAVAPAEMERLVTLPLERRLAGLDHVKTMISLSEEGRSTILIEFEAGQDIDTARQQVRNQTDLARPDLPADMDDPVVTVINFASGIPILTLALASEADMPRLRFLAERLQEAIEAVPGVNEAELSGVREREIRVEIDPLRSAAYGIAPGLVLERIAAENIAVPAGHLEGENGKVHLRVPGELGQATDLRDLPMAEFDGRLVHLRDIAETTDTFKDATLVARFNGRPCAYLAVTKRTGENSVRVIADIKALLEGFPLPQDAEIAVVRDDSEGVATMLYELENALLSGFVIVVLVLMIFLGLRNSLHVALGIPLSMLIAFALMHGFGISLSMVSLFSLIMAVGMVVDNDLVVVENIYRLRSEGLSRLEAARQGAGEVAWPIVTSALTTCLAFSPLLFWPGMVGQFMAFMPKTLILVLAASLFVSIAVHPALCSLSMHAGRRPNPDGGRFTRGYLAALRAALDHRMAVVLLGIGLLAVTVHLYGRYGKGVDLFPDVEPNNAYLEVKFPQGTALEHTDRAVREIERMLLDSPDVAFCQALVGEGLPGADLMGLPRASHLATLYIRFVPHERRQARAESVVRSARERAARMPGAETRANLQERGPPQDAPVAIELTGPDFDMLNDLAATVQSHIETVHGLIDVQNDAEAALSEIRFVVDRERASVFGLDTRAIGGLLRTAVFGTANTTFRLDEDEYDITVRFPADTRETVALLDTLYVPVPGRGAVPLASLGRYEYAGGQGGIRRKDRRRVVTVTGNTEGRGADAVIGDVRERLRDLALPPGYSADIKGMDAEMREAGGFLLRALAIALGLILVILVIQFNSVLLPGVILMSVALSLIGVLWGLLLCGMRFSMIMVGVGIITLAGIVVDNAIVLVHGIRNQREAGQSSRVAILATCRLRMRPVLLTAATTALGLTPLAAGYSLDAHVWPPRLVIGGEIGDWWAPLAVTVIFGLLFATLLTLVFVPVMVSLLDSFVRRMNRWLAEEDGTE